MMRLHMTGSAKTKNKEKRLMIQIQSKQRFIPFSQIKDLTIEVCQQLRKGKSLLS